MTVADLESYNNRPMEAPPPGAHARVWNTAGSIQTRWIGQAIGASANPGDIVWLIGDLGAGKTTFTKGVAAGLGLHEDEITSPSFSLIAEHRHGRIPLYHLDVYRLKSPEELYGLGFDDYLRASDGVIVIEWADLVADALPKDRLIVTLSAEPEDNRRLVCAQAFGEASERLLECIP